MSHPLSVDYKQIVLSYLPLSQFSKLIVPVDAWRMRFLIRYGQPLGPDAKREYLIRAATEYYETAAVTLEYCSATITYYCAAIGGNWDMLNSVADNFPEGYVLPAKVIDMLGDLAGDIFLIACRTNQWQFVQKTADKMLNLISSNEDYIWTPEVYRIFKTNPITRKHKYMNQLLAFAPIPEFTEMIKPYTANMNEIRNIMLSIGRYNRHEPNHWERTLAKLKICAPHGYSADLAEYQNSRVNDITGIQSETTYIQYGIITSFNTANMGEWLIDYDISFDIYTYDDMKNNYLGIPDAEARARETVNILSEYVSQNDILQPYIITIKIILDTITIEDIPNTLGFSELFSGEIIDDLLDGKKYIIINELFNIHKVKTYSLFHYTFKDVETLKYVLRSRNIFITNECVIAKILTLPMIVEIEQLAQDQNVNENNYDIIMNQIYNNLVL